MSGKWYSEEITTAENGEDLFATIKSTLSLTSIVARAVYLLSATDIGVDINNTGAYSSLHLDADTNYRLELRDGEVLASSIKVETAGSVVWVGIVY